MKNIRPVGENVFMRHATSIAIGTVTLLMLLAVLVFWRREESDRVARDWVMHTYETRGHIRLLFSEIKDAEIGQRGYILTGNAEYLEPYEEALRDTPAHDVQDPSTERHRSIMQEIDIIRRLTRDNALQQSNMDELESVVNNLLPYLASTIRKRRATQGAMSTAAFDFTRSREMMNHIRELVRIMGTEETNLLTLRIENDDRNTRQMEWMMFAGIALFYAAMVLSIWMYQRIRERTGIRLNALVYNALDGLVSIDERGRIESFNPACERIFGYSAREVLGRNIKMLMPEPYHSEHDGYLSHYLTTGQARIIGTPGREVSGKRKDGSTFPMDLSVSAFKLEDGQHFSGIIRDITARKQAEEMLLQYTQQLEKNEEALKLRQEELKASNEEIEAASEEMEAKNMALEEQNAQIQQQAEELEESKRLIEEKASEIARASRYKSEFLANMSHELRTPLNSLLILARLLAANEEGNLTDEQVEEARVIHNGGLELLGLINDILDLSKVEAGKLTVNLEDVPLRGIVNRMRQQFAPVEKEKGVTFQVSIAEGLPEALHTDAQRVEQVLKNLLSNAFKFTEKGSVTLEVRRPAPEEMQRSFLGREDAIAFSVIDTGIGIDASKFKDIFEAFQQEDGSIDRHYGGTGLGLTIARKFAHMLGGEIHVASRKGQGSRFTLVLPLYLAHAATEDMPLATPGVPPPGAGEEPCEIPKTLVAEFIPDDRMTIGEKDRVLLIIEDDPVFARTLMKIARRHNYKCLVAGGGKNGLVLALEQPVAAIILDLRLPDIDGLRVLDQLKHDLRTRHIPVHIISGREEAATATPLRKGAIGYLTKPVEMEAIDGMFGRIEQLLQADVKQVLVVEDDRETQVAIAGLLGKKDLNITMAGTGSDALKHMKKSAFDCVILDLQLPDMTGFAWLEKTEKALGDKAPPVIVYTARDLTEEESRKLGRYTGSIVIKGARSPERLLDEVTLFLHSVESTLSGDQQEIIRMQHNPDQVLQGRTLLLADDDLRNTFALSKLLKKHGMNIVIADNGRMALDKLGDDPSIELVIMDIMMPVMDGYQAIREIRGRPTLKELPVIALTARAMPEEQEKCMAAGANDYLVKPVDIERLLTLLRVWLFRQEMAA